MADQTPETGRKDRDALFEDEDQDRAVELEEASEPEREAERPFIVGIGASAGGLEALGQLVKHVPLDNMSFIVVQHLAPDRESVLPQLLSRSSKVEVTTAAESMTVEPNRVYVIPPNTDLALMNGVIHLIAPAGERPYLPIDYFFRTLAQDQGASSIGIILSGTGTDGTLGLRAVKEAGGITFVQDPSSAKYDGMPRSALASGFADFCLPPKEIAEELTRIAKRPHGVKLPSAPARAPQFQEQLARLFILIRSAFGNDLTRYKPSTVERRIERRMILHKIGSLEDYVRYVQTNAGELQALYKDTLITVTNFFRDRTTFEALKTKVFPRVLEHAGTHAPVRVWVPACATGEEAYSIAISLIEFLESVGKEKRIQIFGTDVDEQSIQHARRGSYPQNIELDVSPERLSRFFTKKGTEYHVTRRVRDTVVFSQQNLIKDSPFSRMDLVSCRNLLIYLQPSTQKKVLSILHYSLNTSGYLLLGSSETVGDGPELFSLVDRTSKIYSKKPSGSTFALETMLSGPNIPERNQRGAAPPVISLQALADRKILDVYAPPGVLLNENLDILHFRGHTGPYLDPAPGSASFSILRLARPELRIELKRAIQQAFAEQIRVSTDVKFSDAGKPGAVRLDLVPIQDPETKTRCLLVSFLAMEPPEELPPIPTDEPDERIVALGKRLQELERELEVTKDYLQATIEDKESANEELKSANEELQSSNEELQSTNEELETSREEMQSTNEELTTVNEELQNRMSELGLSNDDLHNLLAGFDNSVLIVGMDFCIRRYTLAAEKLLGLVAGDLGRSISFIDGFFGADVLTKVRGVVETLNTLEEDVLCRNRRWYSVRIVPYKTLDHVIRGAVITLMDIDARKKSAMLTRDVGEYAGHFLGAIHHPLMIVDSKLRIVWVNQPFYDYFQVVEQETIGTIFPNDGDPQWADTGELCQRLEVTLRTGESFRGVLLRQPAARGSTQTLKVGGSRIPVPAESALVLLSFEE